MHKNGKFIPLLALGFTFFLSGCDYFADKHLVEEMKEQQKEQETKINLLEKQQKEQEAKINLLENNKLRLSTQPKRSPKSLAALNANNGYSTIQNWTHHKRTILLLTTAISD